MQELLNKRTYTQKHFQKEDGSFVMEAHAGHQHYRGQDGNLKDVDYTWEDRGAYFTMTKASYKMFVAKDFGANQLIRYENWYRGASHTIVYEPKMLAWVNKTNPEDIIPFRQQQSVQGVIDGNVIRYTDAFGAGIDFEVTLRRSGFTKEIVFKERPNDKRPGKDYVPTALFKYTGDGLKVKSRDKLREWGNTGFFEELDGFRIQEVENEAFQSFVKPAYIYDSGEIPKRENIKVFWKRHNNALCQVKVLSIDFLLNATYPVRADTTTSYYPDVDGAIYYSASFGTNTWNDIITATSGTVYSPNLYVQTRKNTSNGQWLNSRSFVNFDISSLPGSASVSSATVYLKPSSLGTPQAKTYNITGSTFTAHQAEDYDLVTSTIYCDTARAGTDLTVNVYEDFVMNSSGISAITGSTFKIAIREASDYNTTPDPANSSPVENAYVFFYDEENTGTSNDPYLEVTYTTGSTYTLTADKGTFTLTGIATNLLLGYLLTAVTGSYVLTGIATLFKRGYKLVASVGSYVLTGIAVNLLYGLSYILSAATGAFTLTGKDAGLNRGYRVIASAGSYVLTGIANSFGRTYKMAVTVGEFVLTGISAILRIPGRWINEDKNTTNYSNNTKNSSTWDNVGKN